MKSQEATGLAHLDRRQLKNTKPRAIIIKFKDIGKRTEVYGAKKNLKGKKLVITENLTKFRYELYQKAVKKLGFGKVWTNQGRILTIRSGNYFEILNDSDLNF